MVKKKDINEAYARTNGFCACGCGIHFEPGKEYAEGFGGEFHHIYFKSEYRKKDRDEARNLAFLYGPHHKEIHEGKNRELDARLKAEADKRKPIEMRSKEKVSRKSIVYGSTMKKYDKKVAQDIRNAGIEYFKKEHDGLTPSQYAYRKQKLYIDKMKKGRKYV